MGRGYRDRKEVRRGEVRKNKMDEKIENYTLFVMKFKCLQKCNELQPK